MPVFRNQVPTRTCTECYTTYQKYKPHLVSDFNNRCGYCDASDFWYGGYKCYHIDHFAPKKQFPLLTCVYTNLIYACPSCNNAKSNLWPSDDPNINIKNDKGFLNPVLDDLNIHFTRDNLGNIIALSPIAQDMLISLKLHLERHSVLWNLCRLDNLTKEYEDAIDSDKLDEVTKEEFKKIHYDLSKLYRSYREKLKVLNS